MISVLLADSQALVRAGIEHLLRDSGGIHVVGCAGCCEETLEQVGRFRPDVVLLDINLPGVGSIEAGRKISQRYPEIKIIALSAHPAAHVCLQRVGFGAAGYLSKYSPAGELLDGIRSVMAGKIFLSSDVADVIARTKLGQGERSPFEILSMRELEVVQLILSGKDVPEISQYLSISDKTISTYRCRIYRKLGIRNDVELTRLAIKFRLIEES